MELAPENGPSDERRRLITIGLRPSPDGYGLSQPASNASFRDGPRRTPAPVLTGLNAIFEAASALSRGYRKTATFITVIDLIAAPLPEILKST